MHNPNLITEDIKNKLESLLNLDSDLILQNVKSMIN